MAAHIKYNEQQFVIPKGCTARQTLDSLAAAMPELANAKLTKVGKDYKAEVDLGEKG